MRISELFSVLHFPWSGNSQCLWGSDLLLAIASVHSKLTEFVTAASALPRDAESWGEQSSLLSLPQAAALAFLSPAAFSIGSFTSKEQCFPWIHGNIAAAHEFWEIFALLLQAGWQWVNGHSSAGTGWCCVVLPFGLPVCHPGCHGPVHCLGGTSLMQYSPKAHICLRLSFQRFQTLAIFWRDYPVLAGHTFLSSFSVSLYYILVFLS